jgi:hypothetical protein
MIESWHDKFNPKKFLSKVNIDQFIEHNEAYKENRVESLGRPCILCNSRKGPGLLLNDKSYLCKSCFSDISSVKYPEKYERLRRKYYRERESRNGARNAFVANCFYGRKR